VNAFVRAMLIVAEAVVGLLLVGPFIVPVPALKDTLSWPGCLERL